VTCRLFENQLSPYLDGELAATRAARLEAHLRVCPHCQAELSAMRQVSSHIQAISGEVQPSRDFDRRVLRAVGYYHVTGRQTRRRRRLARPLAAVIVMLLGLLTLARHYLSPPPAQPLTPAPQSAAVVVPASPGLPLPADRDRR